METLGIHMKKIHMESDSDRITRLELTIQESLNVKHVPKIFDCSECGEVFKEKSKMYDHFATKHKNLSVEVTPVQDERNSNFKISEQELTD